MRAASNASSLVPDKIRHLRRGQRNHKSPNQVIEYLLISAHFAAKRVARKRKEKEIDELRQYSSQKIVEKLLGSLDNLERAISAAKETNDFEGLVQGVEMILRNIQDVMKSEGVEEIEALGKEFDPMFHHAVMQEDSPEFKDNEVMLELQKGYKMKDKVIRPSMVKVCKKS